jgi:hypothetical protein
VRQFPPLRRRGSDALLQFDLQRAAGVALPPTVRQIAAN